MCDSTKESGLLGRVRQLESSNRSAKRWRWGCLATGTVLVCLGLAQGQDGNDVVRSKRFELVGSDGAVVATLGTDQGSFPFLELSHAGTQGTGGRVRIEVPSGVGPGCAIYDNEGRKRVQLYVGRRLTRLDGQTPARQMQLPQLTLIDDTGQLRSTFGSEQDGSPKIELRGPEGDVVLKLPK